MENTTDERFDTGEILRYVPRFVSMGQFFLFPEEEVAIQEIINNSHQSKELDWQEEGF